MRGLSLSYQSLHTMGFAANCCPVNTNYSSASQLAEPLCTRPESPDPMRKILVHLAPVCCLTCPSTPDV
jgi:hypothetical protein